MPRPVGMVLVISTRHGVRGVRPACSSAARAAAASGWSAGAASTTMSTGGRWSAAGWCAVIENGLSAAYTAARAPTAWQGMAMAG